MIDSKKALKIILALLLVFFITLWLTSSSYAQEPPLYVMATRLNGRAAPTKSSSVEARFERGDQLTPTGRTNGKWVEVEGGETGTVWCHSDYLSQEPHSVRFANTSNGRVRIRKHPDGKPVGWVKENQTITVSNIIDGWGYVEPTGWVNLSFFSRLPDKGAH